MTYINSNISNHLPKITLDYINAEESLKSFYYKKNDIENYLDQIKEKNKLYNHNFREVLKNELLNQYRNLSNNKKQLDQIKRLSDKNTFTVTTGHQLNLFTGPLYFFYKIIDTIKICNQLKIKYPKYNFIPIYWMASEDHDFKEINFFNSNNNKFEWITNSSGPVGRLSTKGLELVFEKMKLIFKNSNEKKILSFFQSSYLKNKNFSDASLSLIHNLFSNYGLVIIQPDNRNLKSLFKEIIKDEILNKNSFNLISKTNTKIKNSLNYKFDPQVHSRKINMFYILDGVRERIEYKNKVYNVLNTEISFSESEIINEINNHTERFSPNALLRPVYQEYLLPNLSYVGGGSEIAYWLQLKDYFDYLNIPFPILTLRSSVLLISSKQYNKCKKLNLSIDDLFKDLNELKLEYLKLNSNILTDFSPQKNSLKKNFKDLYKLAKHTDKSFLGAVKAQEIKQLKGLSNLEKRLIRAEKRKYKDSINRIEILKNELFPNNSFQERHINFSQFFSLEEENFLKILFKNIDPFKQGFKVIKY